jgi:gamma-glutamylcysteine synthetase
VRKIGREAEFPIVDAEGRAFDISALWADLVGPGLVRERNAEGMIVGLNGVQYSYASEVGRGTIEVITGPRHDLIELSRDHEAAMVRLVKVATAHGARVLGMGVQPLTPASEALMTPKPRYGVLQQAIGDAWLSFSATASDQTHVDVAAPEIIPMSNLCNLLSPVIIALCGSSGVVEGVDASLCSWREAKMGEIQPEFGRHGMPVVPAESLAHHLEMLCGLPHLMDRKDGTSTLGDGRPFSALLEGMDDDEAWRAFMVHDHYVWHSARPRSRQGTIEVRCAGQQPWDGHMSAAALSLGLVCGAAELARFVDDELGPEAWSIMRRWHVEVIRHGLAATEPRAGFIRGVLERAKAALRARGRKEATMLDPLFARLDRGANPAQRARALLALEGLDAVIAQASIAEAIG